MRSSLFEFATRVTQRYWRALLIAMLVLLHIAAIRGAEDFWARGLMVAHVGLFIMWQPFMQGQQRLTAVETVGVALISLAILFLLSWWMLGLWVAVLAGVVGGKVFLFRARWLRLFYLLVLLYLVTLLLVWIVPSGFSTLAGQPEFQALTYYGLPVLFLIMALLPVEPDTAEPQIVDFFYAILIFLLLVALVLGSFVFMTLGGVSFAVSLTLMLLTIASVLLVLSVAWNPRAGFSGLSMFFSRYLLTIGLPFEQWLHFLADLSRSESRPEQFLNQACIGLGRLPWVTGGEWVSGGESGNFGTPSRHSVEYAGREVRIRLFSRHRTSPSLVWHFNLLGQLVGQFYTAKQREQKLQQQTYVQALHETGARVTHDVKNLLQSLNVLCSAAEREPEAGGEPGAFQSLIRRHLPVVMQRLQQTLDKLQRPQIDGGKFERADLWWQGVQRAYQMRGVEFIAGTVSDRVVLPKDLFDGALENLVQNALEKRKLHPALKVTARFDCAGPIRLEVCDTGRPVAAELLKGLLRGPVRSDTGYGIGLYQLARQAEVSGFVLELVRNDPGRVCFEVRGEMSPMERAASPAGAVTAF